MSKLRIEYLALDEIEAAPRNAKLHDLVALEASFERFGFVAPPLRDDATGKLVAGHGRIEELRALFAAGEPAPARVENRGGRWFVPVICGVKFADQTEAEAYLLADNRLAALGGYEEQELLEILAQCELLTGTGYAKLEVEKLASKKARERPTLREHGEEESSVPVFFLSARILEPPPGAVEALCEMARAIPGVKVDVSDFHAPQKDA